MTSERHLFPGGNTPVGFFSYYPYILPQEDAARIFCIKGGPGVGKSTFMKKIGMDMAQRGYAVEYMHCSSDPGSLDGLVIPALKTALIDGTAPHVVDPKNPGAVDEIINLGECWRLKGIQQHREEILRTNSAIGRLFAGVYNILGAAKRLHDDLDAIYTHHCDRAGIDAETERILPMFGDRRKGISLGRERMLFASAITPDGLINYLGGLASGYRNVYVLRGAGSLPPAFLRGIAAEAVGRGLDVEEFYCPIDPAARMEHLLIPALSVAFITSNRHHEYRGSGAMDIDFIKYAGASIQSDAEALEFDSNMLDMLLNRAVGILNKAKATHDLLETNYIPHMDFDAVSRKREEVLGRILGER